MTNILNYLKDRKQETVFWTLLFASILFFILGMIFPLYTTEKFFFHTENYNFFNISKWVFVQTEEGWRWLYGIAFVSFFFIQPIFNYLSLTINMFFLKKWMVWSITDSLGDILRLFCIICFGLKISYGEIPLSIIILKNFPSDIELQPGIYFLAISVLLFLIIRFYSGKVNRGITKIT